MMILALVAVGFLAYANGANDNFKGVATLFGSGTTNYRTALAWTTAATFAGSAASVVLAGPLVQRFSGKGLVPDSVAASPTFLLAVAIGAGLTVLLATFTGFPISTTHGLTGALLGAGLMADGAQVNFSVLGSAFVLPLLVSPLMAIALGYAGYALARRLRPRLGTAKEMCVCVGETQTVIPMFQSASLIALAPAPSLTLTVDTRANCAERYTGQVLGLDAQTALNAAHYASAGVVSFARGLNDTPKIAALLLAAQALDVQAGLLLVGVAMAVGGYLNARKVAETMSRQITPLNHGQGFTANLVTGLLVIFASRWGLPVSTTHVSVGSLFGIGLITRQANVGVVSGIILSWVLTLPIAAILSGGVYLLLSR